MVCLKAWEHRWAEREREGNVHTALPRNESDIHNILVLYKDGFEQKARNQMRKKRWKGTSVFPLKIEY